MDTFDAIVIGAGEAGTEVANRAVQAGYRVALIYRPPFGSTCLNAGCVPSKFLIHRARIARLTRTAARFHIDANIQRIRLADMVSEMETMIADYRIAALEAARRAKTLSLIEARARFHSREVVDAGDRRLYAPRIFIATGMRPYAPEGLATESSRVHTSDTIMRLTTPPERLVVVGGGYVACELGQTYSRFGSSVTIVQGASRLLPHEESDVSTILTQCFEAEGIQVLLESRAVSLQERSDAIRMVVRNAAGTEHVLDASHVLLAAGRRPNTDTLALDAAGVVVNAKGYVRVNGRLETNVRGIWAVGDVNGQQPFTRVSQEEGRVAYANAFEGARLTLERQALPHAVFTDPEIGSVGYTESTARELGIDTSVGLVTLDQVVKAKLIGETSGLLKYVVERKTRRIIGCHVIGPNAADLVYDAALVMRHNGTLDEIGLTVGVFPTLQEGMEGAARAHLSRSAPSETRGPLVREKLKTAALEVH
ncbi:MAG: dihydrolipoyl dehydrogenase family protein [Gemmatimonadaceae bacterium]